jgi:hypothetical protein
MKSWYKSRITAALLIAIPLAIIGKLTSQLRWHGVIGLFVILFGSLWLIMRLLQVQSVFAALRNAPLWVILLSLISACPILLVLELSVLGFVYWLTCAAFYLAFLLIITKRLIPFLVGIAKKVGQSIKRKNIGGNPKQNG